MVFQRPKTIPMCVFDNIAFGPRLYESGRKAPSLTLWKKVSAGCGVDWTSKTNYINRVWNFPAGSNSVFALPGHCVEPSRFLMMTPQAALDPISTLRSKS